MAKAEEVFVPLAIIISAFIFFPEQISTLFENNMYYILGGVLIMLFIFFFWLKTRTNY